MIGPVLLLTGAAQAALLEVGEGYAYTQLEQALAQAVDGDTVRLMDSGPHIGAFQIGQTALVLEASPTAAPVLAAEPGSSEPILTLTGNNITVRGMTLHCDSQQGDGIRVLTAGPAVSLSQNTLSHCGYGIHLMALAAEGRSAVVHDNLLEHNRDDIRLHNVTGVWVHHNQARSVSGSGIAIGIDSQHNLIEANRVSGSGLEADKRHGIQISGQHNRVVNNQVHDTTWGISLLQGKHNQILANRVWDNLHENFYLSDGSDYNALEGNIESFRTAFPGYAIGILLYASSGNNIRNHTSVGARQALVLDIKQGPSQHNRVVDSLFVTDTLESTAVVVKDSASHNQVHHSVFHGFAQWQQAEEAWQGLNLYQEDPQLLAPQSGDYHLSEDSWALFAGEAGGHLGALGPTASPSPGDCPGRRSAPTPP
ncbi:right-handed parallel beta-helix repeat-containing protein [Ferrimonas marina]|nr:right-handed parallel beta-helix repeat-containing protein [Ferrimonas marina]